MVGLVIDQTRFYKPSGSRLQVGDEGANVSFEVARTGFELRVVRGKVLSLPESMFEEPPFDVNDVESTFCSPKDEAEIKYVELCGALLREGFRRFQKPGY